MRVGIWTYRGVVGCQDVPYILLLLVSHGNVYSCSSFLFSDQILRFVVPEEVVGDHLEFGPVHVLIFDNICGQPLRGEHMLDQQRLMGFDWLPNHFETNFRVRILTHPNRIYVALVRDAHLLLPGDFGAPLRRSRFTG